MSDAANQPSFQPPDPSLERPQHQHEPDPAMNFQGEMYSQKQYEFTPAENELIANLGGRMRVVGLFSSMIGLVNIVLPFVMYYVFASDRFRITPLAIGLVFLLIGIWTRSAGQSFERITTSEGHDITNLMKAMNDLDNAYSLQYWLILIGLLVLVGIVAFIVVVDSTGTANQVFTY